MSRLFNGTTDFVTLAAGGSNFTFGTMVGVVKLASNGAWGVVLGNHSVAPAFQVGLLVRGTDQKIAWSDVGANRTSALTLQTSDGWCLIAIRKATGTATPRISKIPFSTGTAAHADADSSVGNTGTAQTTIRIGQAAGSDFFPGRIAVVAEAQGVVLSDAEIQGLYTTLTRAHWASLGFTNLNDELDAFLDDAVGTSDRSAISGTTDDADDPAGWASWAGGTDGTATSPAAVGLGDFPVPAFTAGSTITTPAADATGDFPASEMQIGVDVSAPAALTFGDFPVPTVSGTGDSTVTSPAADALGDFPIPTTQWGWTVTAPAATALGDFPAPTVTGTISGSITAAPADATGDFPAPTVTPLVARLRTGTETTGGTTAFLPATGGIAVSASRTGGNEPAYATAGNPAAYATGGAEVELVGA